MFKNARQLSEKGGEHLLRNEDRKALKYFLKAIKKDPGNPEYVKNAGRTLIKLGKYDEALSLFDEVLKRDPTDHMALLGRGNSLQGMGQNREAISVYERVIQLSEDTWTATISLAMAYGNLREYQSALDAVDRCLDNPSVPEDGRRMCEQCRSMIVAEMEK